MAERHPRLKSVVCVLLLIAALVSCVKVRGPGIMPPLEDDSYRQWKVLESGLHMARTRNGLKQWQWQIIARFEPESAESGLKPLDMSAVIDGVPVPFTFEEEGQIFESATPFKLSPGTHRFELTPTSDSSQSFPTLSVDFEVP